ncbi:MAG: 50S ribosomal protein L25 [Candidatus Eremiobacteraeota bacterium]|nr:50S ribosomal protein L25 [Candidatus Eremiobacteraeota bacterium]
MKQVLLEARLREKTGKEYCKKIRRTGYIPAVLYGKETSPVALEIPDKEFRKMVAIGAGYNALVELKIAGNGGNTHLSMISEVQRDPLGIRIFHVDFHKISLDTKVTATIPLHFEGDPKGAKKGGVMEHVLWNVEIETLPLNIPQNIVIDVSHLDIGDEFTIKDIPKDENITITNDPGEIVAVVHAPRAEETPEGEVPAAAVAAPAGSASQPEVIKKGKEEKEKGK